MTPGSSSHQPRTGASSPSLSLDADPSSPLGTTAADSGALPSPASGDPQDQLLNFLKTKSIWASVLGAVSQFEHDQPSLEDDPGNWHADDPASDHLYKNHTGKDEYDEDDDEDDDQDGDHDDDELDGEERDQEQHEEGEEEEEEEEEEDGEEEAEHADHGEEQEEEDGEEDDDDDEEEGDDGEEEEEGVVGDTQEDRNGSEDHSLGGNGRKRKRS